MEAYRRGGCRLRRVAPAALLVAAVAVASTAAFGAGTASKAAAASTSGVGTGRERLPGHQGLVPPGATLVGPAPAATALPLVVTLKPRDPSALAAAVQAISDPGSPQYRRFLTPAQFAQQFGPTTSTIRQVTSALRQEGLTVGAPSSTGLSLPVSGTVAQVQSAFATSISKYHLSSGKTGYDNASAPEVPASVAPQIEGILGLDTLSPPQPSTSVPQASPAASHPEAAAVPVAPAQGQPSPVAGNCATSISSVQSTYGALDAPQLAQAYSFDSLYSSSDYGAGSTVALVEPSGTAGYSAGDISTFANCYGITPGNITSIPVGGGGATGTGTMEAELDIETVLSLAPKANIEVYEGGASSSLYDVFNQIVSDDSAKIVSDSWINGCEAYVGQSLQNSENTLFQAAATEGQSIFVATGDQGSEGCNVNGKIAASTGSNPVAQAVDPATATSPGTLYIANESSNTVSVDSEGSTSNPANFGTAYTVNTGVGSGPDAVVFDKQQDKVFVANSGGTLTVIPTTTCNQSTGSGCSSPTQVASGGNLNDPTALAVSGDGSTLYVGNGNGTVAVYNAGSNAWVATVNLASGSVPTALAVDPTNGFVYVADGANNRIEYFDATICNATAPPSGCLAPPTTVTVGHDPVAMAVASTPGNLYVANAGSSQPPRRGGISVVSLSTHAVVATIPPLNGTGVQSIGLSPDGNEVLAVLSGLSFPGDGLATINTTMNAITATVNLGTGTDSMGQLVSDGTLDYVWVTDQTSGGDVLQNLNLAVSDPASQPYVTAVGGTSLNLGPPPTEQAWNDALGAGGGGISKTFTMPAYQQLLGTVSGSSGTPCANAGGKCREVPDVSADADPSTGYIIYDGVNGLVNGSYWYALAGTSGAAPLWAAVVAVVASANSTAGYGALNPALYQLAHSSPGTFNDVTTGNNDYNATDGDQFPAMSGYDMATGLGTPVASALATGLAPTPLPVAVSGTQTYGGSPTFTAVPNFSGPGTTPSGVTLNTSDLSCTTVGTSTTISPTLTPGAYTLLASSCSGLTLTGADAGYYSVAYTTAANDFTAAAPPPTPPATPATPPPPTYGYWLVGSDGGIFTFGSAQFHGSTGNLRLQRPVVGISPTASKAGYWLVASDGGVFAFGDAGYFGSIPGAGLHPAGSGLPHSLNAPIVGMVPSSDGGGYFMVASDGGVFAFGDARFEGSCPGIGGCSGAAVAVVPDASGNGYWLITQSGSVYAFGDAPFYGAPGGQGSPVTSAVRTADGHGYWVLLANGTVNAYGDAVARGGPVGSVGGLNPASAIFSDATGGGYWVASGQGAVFSYGDAPNDGSMAGTHLNGSIIAATGF
jgi:DNA-binding beta-propeller fold protein YncE